MESEELTTTQNEFETCSSIGLMYVAILPHL